MGYGKTIELFFVDGKPSGIVAAMLSNWDGKAIKIPRTDVGSCEREDIQGIGVYFLLCEDADGAESVYIGEAENIRTRLVQHLRDYTAGRERYYWNTAIAFTGRDLDKACIRFLENRFVETACKLGHMKVLTQKSYKNTVMKESQIATMEEFGDKVEILLDALGCKALTPPSKPTASTTYLRCKAGNGASAQGFASAGGFTVLADSLVSPACVPSFAQQGSTYHRLRQQLMGTGVIADGSFSQDYEFSSPSAASSVVLGRSSNGNIGWKTEEGRSLREL